MPKQFRKSFRVLAWALALTMVLAACATPTPEVIRETITVRETVVVPESVVVTATPEPEGPVTISFWHGYNPVETEMLDNTVIPMFAEEHPNIIVEAVAVPFDEFRRKLLTSIAGGTAPDLIRADIAWVPEFADMGALAALNEVMPDFDENAAALFPGPLSTNLLNGNYYGLPLDTNTRVMVYNKDMFEQAGITEPPATIDEFLTDCAAIKALGPDKYCFADGGTYAWAVNPWIWSFGGDVTNADITAASGTLNGSATIEAYEFLKTLVDDGYIHPGILGGGIDTWGGLANDQIAMVLEGPWFPPLFESQFPDKEYGFAPMPAGAGGSISVVGGEDIVMFQQSDHKEAAAEFIRFMLSPEIQLKMAEVGQMPVRNDLLTSDAIQDHPFFGPFLEQLETAHARTPHPMWPRMEEVLTQAGGAILAGEASAQQALDDAAAQIDALLGAQ